MRPARAASRGDVVDVDGGRRRGNAREGCVDVVVVGDVVVVVVSLEFWKWCLGCPEVAGPVRLLFNRL